MPSKFKGTVDMGDAKLLMPLQRFSYKLGFADAGSGASTTVDISAGFPANAVLVSAMLEIDTVWTGEVDAALQIGDVADPNGLATAFTLDSVAVGWAAALAPGAEVLAGGKFEAAYSPRATFTATELGDLTAGDCTIHIMYYTPSLDSL